MKITFSVSYLYYPLSDENDRLQAEVSVRIPKEQGKADIPLYCCGKIGDREIDVDEGVDTGDSKLYWVEFYAESPEELNKKIDYAIEQYRKQVLQNIEIVKKTRKTEKSHGFPYPYLPDPDC
jgi:uncharacterized protein (DUF2344 family)